MALSLAGYRNPDCGKEPALRGHTTEPSSDPLLSRWGPATGLLGFTGLSSISCEKVHMLTFRNTLPCPIPMPLFSLARNLLFFNGKQELERVWNQAKIHL